jgi:hypothetical protein
VGPGVATGGTANQVLKKVDGTDYNTTWGTIAGAVYQASAPSTPQTGDVWVDSDAVAGVLNQNDYLLKADASAPSGYLLKTDAAGTYATQTNFPAGAWTTYTPTVTATTGSITSYTSSGRYTRIGKTVVVWFTYNITNNGTGSATVDVSLPIAGNSDLLATGSGIQLSTGAQIQGFMTGPSTVRIALYNFGYPSANMRFTMTYEAA